MSKPQHTILKKTCRKCGKVLVEVSTITLQGKQYRAYKCGHIFPIETAAAVNTQYPVSKDDKHLYPFQQLGVDFARKANYRCLILDEQGLGKTVQALATLKDNEQLWPTLVIAKSALVLQIQSEAVRWLGDAYMPMFILDSKTAPMPGFRLYIISYDMLARIDKKVVEKIKKKYPDDEFAVTAERIAKHHPILKLGIKTVIMDEIQQIKNTNAARTHAVRRVCRDINHIMGLSGTPFYNNTSEYFPALNLIEPETFPSMQHFIERYCDYYRHRGGYKIGGLRDIEEFKAKTSHFIIRRTQKEVLPDLPSLSRLFHKVDFDSQRLEQEYVAAYKEFKDAYETASTKNPTALLGMMAVMRHITGLAKIPACIDDVTDFLLSTDRKITIFVHHKDVMHSLNSILGEWCKEGGFAAPLLINAEQSNEARNKVVSELNDGDSRILIASTLVAGEGLNLQKACSDAILLEREWNPAREEQAEKRFHRIGTKEAVAIKYMICIGTIDEFFTEIVERKRMFNKQALDFEVHPWNESTLMSELVEALASSGGKRWSL